MPLLILEEAILPVAPKSRIGSTRVFPATHRELVALNFACELNIIPTVIQRPGGRATGIKTDYRARANDAGVTLGGKFTQQQPQSRFPCTVGLRCGLEKDLGLLNRAASASAINLPSP